MRWVDRGPEPNGVAGYARQFAQGWVDYVQSDGVGGRPTDSFWREFRSTLGSRTNNICWYCERQCYADSDGRTPTVDHFQPISLFPQLAYEWSNWIFSCRRCNEDNKGNLWPETGYVDPCAAVVSERPEQYFDYDADTGEVVPRNGLSATALNKAQTTIDYLGLNKLDLRFYRLDWTRGFIADLLQLPVSERQAITAAYVEQSREYAGIAVMLMEQLRRDEGS